MIILGIDPGPEESWWVKWDTEKQRIVEKGVCPNAEIPLSYQSNIDMVIIEEIQCFGMPVGREIFQTAIAIGRFLEKAGNEHTSTTQVGRREIKLHFCNSTKAKDSNIRKVLLDRFGKEITKGLKYDLWSAFALAIYWDDKSII